MIETRIVDTNVLLRFLTGEPPDQAKLAREVVAQADRGELILEILPLVLAETVFTLESFYQMPKAQVCDQLRALLQSRGIRALEEAQMLDALERHRRHNVHFVDACIAAAGAANKKTICSFDRDFDRFKDVEWVNPHKRSRKRRRTP